MTGTITTKTKREDQRKAKRQTSHMNPKQKKGRELVPLVVYCLEGNYVT
jgi:hypothetical protein